MTDTSPSKAQLRSTLRQRRNALVLSERQTAAHALTQHVVSLPAWTAARRIAVYLAADGEIDTQPIERLARAQEKQVYLPVIGDDLRLAFAAWQAGAPLSPNRFNIPEPAPGSTRCPASDLDIIFLPLVAFDVRGGRLGMGGGYYDRTLSGVDGPVLVGLAHACQQVESVPVDAWDITLDFIATDVALHRRQTG